MKKLLPLLLFLSAGAFAQEPREILDAVGVGSIVTAGIGVIIIFVGAILAYVAISFGIYLLSKKYSPKIHPAWSWIPVANIYPFVAVTGQPLWWIAVIIIGSFIPTIGGLIEFVAIVYLYYHLSKRVGKGVGTTILLMFFSSIMIPYLGCKANKKSTAPAWILGILATVIVLTGVMITGIGAGIAALNIGRNSDFIQGKIEEYGQDIQNNPELQKNIDTLKSSMQALDAENKTVE